VSSTEALPEEGRGYVEVKLGKLHVTAEAGDEPKVKVEVGDLGINVGIIKEEAAEDASETKKRRGR
jgi:hypothetical protein